MISIHTIEVGDIVYLDVAKENRDWGFNPGHDGTKCEVVSFDSESHISKGEPNKFWPTIRYLEGERKGETEPMLTLHLSTDNPKERPVFQPTVKNIVIEYLQKNGFDGLVNVDTECGCHMEDLAPCGQVCEDCEAGYQVPCDCGSCDYHISRKKPVECPGCHEKVTPNFNGLDWPEETRWTVVCHTCQLQGNGQDRQAAIEALDEDYLNDPRFGKG